MEPDYRSVVARVLTGADPGRRLRALAELRRELDSVETELAADALRAGLSWREIGEALGISKQAAHRRHSHGVARLDQAAETQHRGSTVLVAAEARLAVRVARREAAAAGERTVGTEHLLLGLLQCGDRATLTVLRRLGIGPAEAREAMHPTVELAVTGVSRRGSRSDPADAAGSAAPDEGAGADNTDALAPLSPLARDVLARALAEAAESGAEALTAMDLLAALLRHDNAGAAQTLRQLGVDASMVRAELRRG